MTMKDNFPVPMPEDMKRYIIEHTARLILKSGMCLEDAVSDAVGFAIFNELFEPYVGEHKAIEEIMLVEGQFSSDSMAQSMTKAVASRLLDMEILDNAVSEYCWALLYHTDRISAQHQVRARLEHAIADPTAESRLEAVRLLEMENFRLSDKLNAARCLLSETWTGGNVEEGEDRSSISSSFGHEALVRYVMENVPTDRP